MLFLFPISIYLPMLFTNILTIIMALFIIINYKKLDFRQLVNNKAVMLMSVLYSLIFLGFFYDINTEGVFNDLEKKLSFLILPVAGCVMKISKQDVRKVLAVFFFFRFFIYISSILRGTFRTDRHK